MLGQQQALLALQVEQDERLALGQRMAHPQHASFQRRVVAVVGAVAGDEVLDQAGQGFGLQLVVGDQDGPGTGVFMSTCTLRVCLAISPWSLPGCPPPAPGARSPFLHLDPGG